MKLSIVRLFTAGKPLSRQDRARQVPVEGCLRVEQIRLEERARFVKMARVVQPERPAASVALPPLHDPVLVSMGVAAFTLSGFELVHGTAYGQTWLCRETTGSETTAALPDVATPPELFKLPEASHG